jgi:DNA processing protein
LKTEQDVEHRETLRYWLALLHVRGVGPVTFSRLLGQAGSVEALFHGQPPPGLPPALLAALRQPDWDAVERDLAWLEQDDCHILMRGEAAYPVQLAELPDAPPLLFVRGDPAQLSQLQLAMVGSRNPSVIGKEIAHDFARHLAASGMGITSGLAQGIDAASHQGALAGGGQTVAVFATGLDRVYPAANRALAHQIVSEGGALVSEHPPGTPPVQGNFPSRNRIISGLSLGTLVVEAALRSGSLITARLAAEQGREVFAIPGSIHNPLARGCHRLIRDGAKLVETASDILEELAPQLQAAIEQDNAVAPSHSLPEDTPGRQLLGCLGDGPSTIDQLVARSGLTAEAVSSMLLLLELQGQVITTAGGYVRAGKRNQ